MEPKIIKRDDLILAGIMGDGSKTAELWREFEIKSKAAGLDCFANQACYEVRLYRGDLCDCFVGVPVTDEYDAGELAKLKLPASEYAVFDVAAANGYDSENEHMDEWLKANSERYVEAELDGKVFAVEYYGERFKDGIVEIWMPLKRVQL